MIWIPLLSLVFGQKKTAGPVACGSESKLEVISEPQANRRHKNKSNTANR